MRLSRLFSKYLHAGVQENDALEVDHFSSTFVSQSRHIIIGGCGRSGTTLLRTLLDSHRNIVCGPESGVFLRSSMSVKNLADKYQLSEADVSAMIASSSNRGEFIDHFANSCCELSSKVRWAEKTPRNITRVSQIFSSFPNARFLHIIRDGRDVVCSFRTHPRHRVVDGELVPVVTDRPIAECANRWVSAIESSRDFWSDTRFYTVKYESLVNSTRATLEGILDFIGEPWDEHLLEHAQVKSLHRDVTKFPQNPEATQPIYTKNVGRWRKDLSDEDKRVFKKIAGEILIELGYVTCDSW